MSRPCELIKMPVRVSGRPLFARSVVGARDRVLRCQKDHKQDMTSFVYNGRWNMFLCPFMIQFIGMSYATKFIFWELWMVSVCLMIKSKWRLIEFHCTKLWLICTHWIAHPLFVYALILVHKPVKPPVEIAIRLCDQLALFFWMETFSISPGVGILAFPV
jgi:hypothetical protein